MFFPKQVYLFGVLTPFKGLHPWAAWFCLCLRSSLGALGHMILHLSPTCLPHLSPTLGALGRMILHLLHSFPACLPHLSPTLGALGRVILHLSPICLPHLSPTLGALGRMLSHWSPTCLPHLSPTLGALGRMTLHVSSTLGCSGPHGLTLISRTSLPLLLVECGAVHTVGRGRTPHTCLPLRVLWAACFHACLPHVYPTLVFHSGCSRPHDFTLVSHINLPFLVLTLASHLSPTLVSHSGCSGPHDFLVSRTCCSLWVLVSYLSRNCLPLCVLWAARFHTCLLLVSRTCFPSVCSGPRAFKHLSPTLVCLSGWSGRHDFTYVFHLTSTVFLLLFTIEFIHIWGLCWCNQL